MNGGYFAAILAIFALSLVLGAWLMRRDTRDGPSTAVVVIPSLLVALLFLSCLSDAARNDRLGSLRVTAFGADFSRQALHKGVLITARNGPGDLHLAGMGEAQVRIRLQGEELTLAASRLDPKRTLLIRNRDGSIERLGRRDLRLPAGFSGRLIAGDSPNGGGLNLAWKAEAGAPLQARFSQPDSVTLFIRDLRKVFKEKGGKGLVLFAGAIPAPPAERPPTTMLDLPRLGGPLADEMAARILVRPNDPRVDVFTPTLRQSPGYGREFRTGGDRSVVMRVDRLDGNWRGFALTGWLPYLCLLVSLTATFGLRRRSLPAFAILSMIDLLLVIRLLVAMSAAYVSERADFVSAVGETLQSLAMGPFLAAALVRRADRDALIPTLVQGLFALVVVLMVAINLGQFSAGGEIRPGTWANLAGVLIGLSALLGAPLAARFASRAPAAGGSATSFGAKVESRLRHAVSWAGKQLADPSPWPSLIFLVGLGAVRLVLAMVGLREAFPIGPRMSVTLVFLPLLLSAAGWALLRVAQAARRATTTGEALLPILAYWAALVFALVWTIFARDMGFVFPHIWAFLLLAALAGIALFDRRPVAATVLIAPWFIAGLALAVANLGAATAPDQSYVDRVLARNDTKASLAMLGDFARTDGTWLRLLQFVAPDRYDTGTAHSENLNDLYAALEVYASEPLGRGYIPVERPVAVVAKYQLDDNVSAVHLLSPFGTVGAAALLLALLCGAGVVGWQTLSRAEWDLARLTMPQTIALLALFSLVLVDLYMVLANLRIAPFVGRNVYLMAAASSSDLLEGLTLLAGSLALLTWAPADRRAMTAEAH